MSAIENALKPYNVQVTETPLFPERILALIQAGKEAAMA
jgi:hypothetical protein